jgi:hypothetical protein
MFSKLTGAVLTGLGVIALSGCATGLPTKVTRYSALPAPSGQTFYVVPESGAPTLEFGRFASIVAQQLQQEGYRPAGAPQTADLLVRMSYNVDQGHREYTVDPFARSRFYDPFFRGGYDPFFGGFYGRPYYSRFGYYGARSPFYYGWNDPFWYYSPYAGYGGGFRDPIDSYVVYRSDLDMTIARRADNQPLFEGHVKARSQTDELGVLVPNLIEAMFTNFPGRSGETVKITVPARKG